MTILLSSKKTAFLPIKTCIKSYYTHYKPAATGHWARQVIWQVFVYMGDNASLLALQSIELLEFGINGINITSTHVLSGSHMKFMNSLSTLRKIRLINLEGG